VRELSSREKRRDFFDDSAQNAQISVRFCAILACSRAGLWRDDGGATMQISLMNQIVMDSLTCFA
jgi:hypothetical protein